MFAEEKKRYKEQQQDAQADVSDLKAEIIDMNELIAKEKE